MIETENPKSTERTTSGKGGVREGAGAKALPPEMKMTAYKINARNDDWAYLGLFVDASVEEAQRTPGHLFRAAVAHLRLFAPNGPDKPFYVHDPTKPRKVATTPAVAREAARRGISKAELINEMYAMYKASIEKAQKGVEG